MLTKQELWRQVLHIIIGLVTIILLYFDLLSSLSIFLLIIVGIVSSFLSKRIWLPFFSFFLKHLEREKQKKVFPGKGLIFFFIGVLLVIKLFDKDIALASIMILTLGDSISHIIGGKFGTLRNLFNWESKKLFEGTLAGAIAGFLGALLFVPVSLAFVGSFVAMIAEVMKIDFNDTELDDNLVVPLIAGTVMFLMVRFL